MSAIRALLSDLIDYAGMFPPAGLDMAEAVRNYDAYRRGEYGWALGRFVVPAARLDELSVYGRGDPMRLTVLGMPHESISDESIPNVETLELKATQSSEIEAAISRLPANAIAYFEILANEDGDKLIPTLARHHARAKVRTGGVTERAFPRSQDLIRFLANCKRAGVSWKATAGLHHPIRGVYRLTYEPDSPSCVMHGFVNLFLAAARLNAGGSEDESLAILEETFIDAFEFKEDVIRWRSATFTTAQIRNMRQNFAISFGSCSFEDPIADLKALDWL
jgi:hypothetical protein